MTDQVANQEQHNEAPEPTANEVEARSAGWVPKEDYHGDENKWVDADEFVRRGPLFKKIDTQQRELKEIKKALDQLKVHHATVKESAYKDALADLKAQKKEAFIDGNADLIVELDEKIDTVRDEQRQFNQNRHQEVAQEATAEIHPEFQAWKNRNAWYDASRPMKAFADTLGIELREGGMSPSEVLKQVEVQIKKEFPHKFQNANRDKASSVEGVGKGGGKGGRESDNLSEMERGIMNRFVRQGIMTEAQYKADLKKSKES